MMPPHSQQAVHATLTPVRLALPSLFWPSPSISAVMVLHLCTKSCKAYIHAFFSHVESLLYQYFRILLKVS